MITDVENIGWILKQPTGRFPPMALERQKTLLWPPLEFKLMKYTAPIVSAVNHVPVTRDSDERCEDVIEAVRCGRYEGAKASAFLHAPGSAGPAKSELRTTGYNP